MNVEIFKDNHRKVSIVCFVQESDLRKLEESVRPIAKLDHVKLIVQPCAYEGIEFLYRVPLDISGQITSFDREIFWHAIPLKKQISQDDFSNFSQHHYDFIVSILQQDAKKVSKERKAIHLFLEQYKA